MWQQKFTIPRNAMVCMIVRGLMKDLGGVNSSEQGTGVSLNTV